MQQPRIGEIEQYGELSSRVSRESVTALSVKTYVYQEGSMTKVELSDRCVGRGPGARTGHASRVTRVVGTR